MARRASQQLCEYAHDGACVQPRDRRATTTDTRTFTAQHGACELRVVVEAQGSATAHLVAHHCVCEQIGQKLGQKRAQQLRALEALGVVVGVILGGVVGVGINFCHRVRSGALDARQGPRCEGARVELSVEPSRHAERLVRARPICPICNARLDGLRVEDQRAAECAGAASDPTISASRLNLRTTRWPRGSTDAR